MGNLNKLYVGKKVVIKNLTELYKENSNFRNEPPSFTDEMDDYAGESAVIVDICGDDIYLDIDDNQFAWNPKWLKYTNYLLLTDNDLFDL